MPFSSVMQCEHVMEVVAKNHKDESMAKREEQLRGAFAAYIRCLIGRRLVDSPIHVWPRRFRAKLMDHYGCTGTKKVSEISAHKTGLTCCV
jgi:hypothetical protein